MVGKCRVDATTALQLRCVSCIIEDAVSSTAEYLKSSNACERAVPTRHAQHAMAAAAAAAEEPSLMQARIGHLIISSSRIHP